MEITEEFLKEAVITEEIVEEVKKVIDTMPPGVLTFVAEELGNGPSELVVPVLLNLLTHSSSLVIEGVIYGLGKHINYEGVKDALLEQLERETSPGVKEAILEELENA